MSVLQVSCRTAATTWREDQPGARGRIRPHRPGRRQIAQAAKTDEIRANRRCPCRASKCARRRRKTTAGHHDRPGEQRFHTGKRKLALHVTRTAHCQRENDESRRKGRPRRFPESKKRPKIVTDAHAARGAFIQSGELPV